MNIFLMTNLDDCVKSPSAALQPRKARRNTKKRIENWLPARLPELTFVSARELMLVWARAGGHTVVRVKTFFENINGNDFLKLQVFYHS